MPKPNYKSNLNKSSSVGHVCDDVSRHTKLLHRTDVVQGDVLKNEYSDKALTTDINHFSYLVDTQQLGQRMNGPAVLQIADHGNRQTVAGSNLLADRVHVEQCLERRQVRIHTADDIKHHYKPA